MFEEHKGDLVAIAREIALELHAVRGKVSSPEVLEVMRERGMQKQLANADARFMGCVFRKGWERIGMQNTGSHRRPVSVWKRRAA